MVQPRDEVVVLRPNEIVEITVEMVNYENEDETKKTKNDSKGENGAKAASKKARRNKPTRRRKS